jgi:hypothetical protein
MGLFQNELKCYFGTAFLLSYVLLSKKILDIVYIMIYILIIKIFAIQSKY